MASTERGCTRASSSPRIMWHLCSGKDTPKWYSLLLTGGRKFIAFGLRSTARIRGTAMALLSHGHGSRAISTRRNPGATARLAPTPDGVMRCTCLTAAPALAATNAHTLPPYECPHKSACDRWSVQFSSLSTHRMLSMCSGSAPGRGCPGVALTHRL